MLCVIACLFSGIDGPASAQSIQRTALSAWETELIERHTNQYRETLKLARQHGWPLRKNYANRPVFQLQRVDSFGQPIYYTLHNREAAQSTRTTSLYGGGSLPVALTGGSPSVSGRLGMWDGGRVLATHQEFAGSATGKSRVTHADQPTTVSDHATHLAGTLVAGGLRPEAKGMAYGATLSVWDYTNDIAELTTAAPKLLVSNHAYGPVVGWVYNPSRPGTNRNLKWEWWGNTTVSTTDDYQFGFYTATARDLDQIAYNNPFLLIVRSADNKRAETGPPAQTPYFLKSTNVKSTVARSRNDAYDVIPAEATAKNVLTVGAAEIMFNAQNQLTTLETAAYSGWGPTDDGRIKPDLLGIGTNVFSTVSSGNAGYGNNSGTSVASANVAGSLFLLQELYAQQRAKTGGPSTAGQFMRAATLRGLALHTADRLNPAAGPDYRQGWGLLNTEAAARVILNANLAHLIREQTLAASGFVYRIMAQGNEPLIATLCWTDLEGTATPVATASVNSRTPKLVNDLDLRLADGQTTRLPFVLDPNRPGQSATPGDNSRDNVEQIYITNPVPGQVYTLSVTYKGKLTYDGQPFSIIVSGLRRAACQLTATIDPAGDALICAGETLLLKAGNRPGTRYEWLRDGVVMPAVSGLVCPVDKAGSYALRMTESPGCSALSRETTVRLSTVNTLPILPEETDLLLLQGATVTLKAPAAADYRYQWYRDNLAISKATQQQFSVSQPGIYKVQVTQQNCVGWSSERTVRMAVVLTAVTPDPAASLILYPNPAENLLSVRYTNPVVKQVQVSILDLRGVLQQRPIRLKSVNGRFETNLSVADLPAGHYLLQLSDGVQLQTERFVKK